MSDSTPYLPIPLAPAVPDSIRAVVAERIEPNLRDVRLMLEYPKVDGDPGFNLSAASALFSVIGGLSRVFYSGTKPDSQAFPAAAARYPLPLEPWDAISDPDHFGTELYEVYRCNLVHSLGLTVEWSKALARWEVVSHGTQRKVVRQKPLPVTSARLAELDVVTHRPTWLGPTLSSASGVIRLNTDALYWGVRRLARDLAEDTTLHATAETFVRPWYLTRKTSDAAVASSTTPVIVQTQPHAALESTLGAISLMVDSVTK